MHKMILRLDCGVGMNSADAFLITDEEYEEFKNPEVNDSLSSYAWEAAVEFAEGYGIYPFSDQPEDWDEDADDEDSYGGRGDEYSEDIEGWFEEYDPEKHDGLRVGGSDWEWKTL